MKGYSQTLFKHDLTRVPAHCTKNPGSTLPLAKILGATVLERAADCFGNIEPHELVRRLPAKVFQKKFTFDQLCKTRYGQLFTMDSSVEELFRNDPEYHIVQKIQNSMWRWGCGNGVWNELVDAYNGLRSFSIQRPDFDVRLDFTTGYNERGYSQEARVYLDGVFGILIYYKGEHVLTLGFSFMKGRHLLVQQIQLAKRKGNRFLFKIPANRVEFLLQRLSVAFPRHKLCMVDGLDICKTNLCSYRNGLDQVMARSSLDGHDLEEKQALELSIAHLTADTSRLVELYANTGSFKRESVIKVNSIRHYTLRCASQMTVAE